MQQVSFQCNTLLQDNVNNFIVGKTKEHEIKKKQNYQTIFNDTEGIFYNKQWFKKQCQYFSKLPIEYQKIVYKWFQLPGWFTEEEDKVLQCIILSSPTLLYPLTVYKGTSLDYANIDKIFKNTKFNSFTIKISVTSKFLRSTGCIYKLNLCKGAHCLFLPTLEYEILCPKNCFWKFIGETTQGKVKIKEFNLVYN
jgi:hypothetical protein